MRLRRAALAAAAALLLTPAPGAALQDIPPFPTVEEGVKVYVLTIGPGPRIWEVWSHNALWVRDPVRGLDVAYNWGMFDFAQEGFMLRFVRGEMLYSMQGFDAPVMIRAYAASNRTIWAQELALTPEQAEAVVREVLATDTEQNRFYAYDYYLDNCSTRVRDAIDRALGGQLGRQLRAVETGTTWRWHTRRILQDNPPAYLGIHLGLGQPADEALSAWQESFLPMRFREHLRAVSVGDPSGGDRPLVVREVEVFHSTYPLPPEAPPRAWPIFLAAGLGLVAVVGGGGWVGLGRRRQGMADGAGRPARAPLALTAAGGAATLWSLAAGLAGVFFTLAWILTEHTFWYRNENLLQTSPLALVLAVLLVAGHRGSAKAARWLAPVGLTVAALSLLGFALQALPLFDQANGEILALTLPANAAVAWLAVRLGRE